MMIFLSLGGTRVENFIDKIGPKTCLNDRLGSLYTASP